MTWLVCPTHMKTVGLEDIRRDNSTYDLGSNDKLYVVNDNDLLFSGVKITL